MRNGEQRMHLAMTATRWGLLLTIALCCCCSRKNNPVESRDLVVAPGRGISGLCELGMTPQELKRAGSVVCHSGTDESRWPWPKQNAPLRLLLPSLGAIVYLDSRRPAALIEFHVQECRMPDLLDVDGARLFRGRIEAGPSFREGPVTKEAVEALFGRLPGSTGGTFTAMCLDSGRSFCQTWADGSAQMNYFDKGINFCIHSNAVTSFQVYPPWRNARRD
jgi:hypothetical protein